MSLLDPDLAALIKRLPVLRRHERLIRTRLHPFAIRHPGTYGDTLHRTVAHFRDNAPYASRAERAFMKQMVVFADHVIGGKLPEDAAVLACEAHPDPEHTIGGSRKER